MKSITTYGCEVWCIKEKNILSLETDFWRTSANTSRREKVRNEVIRGNGYNNTILDDVWSKPLVWYGHVETMGEEKLPEKFKLDTHLKKEKRETKNRMERRRAESDGRNETGRTHFVGDWVSQNEYIHTHIYNPYEHTYIHVYFRFFTQNPPPWFDDTLRTPEYKGLVRV